MTPKQMMSGRHQVNGSSRQPSGCGRPVPCGVSSSSSSISRFEDDDEDDDDDEDERLALPIASRPHQSPSVYGKALRAR
jgi:hypothetical protein